MNFSTFNEESAKVVGSIDLSKMRKAVFDPPKTKAHNTMRPGGGNVPHYVTKADLDALEHILDRLFAHYNIDITFTRHFLDRINDARNMEQITIAELQGLFQKAYQKVGAKLPKMAGIEAVLVDIQSKINVPFAMNVGKDGDLELVSKTIMRKNNFMTSNPKIKVEQNMKSFDSFITESRKLDEMSVEEWQKDAADAADFLHNHLQKMFPGQTAYARVEKRLGMTIVVSVYAVKKGSPDLDHLNAKAMIKFMMHLNDNFGRIVPMDKFEYEAIQAYTFPADPKKYRDKVKYRKVSGKSPMEASKKLLKWIEDNREKFMLVV